MSRLLLTKRQLLKRAAIVGICAPAIIRPSAAQLFSISGNSAAPGYDNVNNWPAIAGLAGFTTSNRPTLSGSTLSWVGPTLSAGGGAVPSTTNDTAQSISLSTVSGFTTSINGQVVDGLKINGLLTIAHNNVTVQRCYGNGAAVNGTASAIAVNAGVTGLVVQDCALFGSGIGDPNGDTYTVAHSGSVASAMPNTTLYRCNLWGGEKQIGQVEDGVSAFDCLFHFGVGGDSDMFAIWGGSASVNIQHCYFTDVDSTQTTDTAINCGTYLGNVPGPVTINGCGFYMPKVNSSHTVIVQASYTPGGTIGGFTATNNGIVSPYVWQWYGKIGLTLLANTGNFNMASSTSLSGSLVNGSGAF